LVTAAMGMGVAAIQWTGVLHRKKIDKITDNELCTTLDGFHFTRLWTSYEDFTILNLFHSAKRY
jgi:hypothetical protein